MVGDIGLGEMRAVAAVSVLFGIGDGLARGSAPGNQPPYRKQYTYFQYFNTVLLHQIILKSLICKSSKKNDALSGIGKKRFQRTAFAQELRLPGLAACRGCAKKNASAKPRRRCSLRQFPEGVRWAEPLSGYRLRNAAAVSGGLPHGRRKP